jgi:hypothetical protein
LRIGAGPAARSDCPRASGIGTALARFLQPGTRAGADGDWRSRDLCKESVATRYPDRQESLLSVCLDRLTSSCDDRGNGYDGGISWLDPNEVDDRLIQSSNLRQVRQEKTQVGSLRTASPLSLS